MPRHRPGLSTPSLDRHSTLLPSLAFALSQIVLYLQALACFATRADCSIRTYYLRVFPLSLEHMGARRPGQATAIPPRLVYGVSGPQTQPLSNSVERCCWTEPKLMQRISRPRHGTGLVCLQRSTPLPLHLGAYYCCTGTSFLSLSGSSCPLAAAAQHKNITHTCTQCTVILLLLTLLSLSSNIGTSARTLVSLSSNLGITAHQLSSTQAHF